LKFLLDENLSALFIEKIKKKYPGSVDIFDIGYFSKFRAKDQEQT
jgi:hypothetical protein